MILKNIIGKTGTGYHSSDISCLFKHPKLNNHAKPCLLQSPHSIDKVYQPLLQKLSEHKY